MIQIQTGEERGEGRVRPIPPPFPNPTRGRCGKGAGRLMIMMAFQVNVWFEEVLASPPWGRRERGLYSHFPKTAG